MGGKTAAHGKRRGAYPLPGMRRVRTHLRYGWMLHAWKALAPHASVTAVMLQAEAGVAVGGVT